MLRHDRMLKAMRIIKPISTCVALMLETESVRCSKLV
jgi:hypothetical protein